MTTRKHIDNMNIEELEAAMEDPDQWDWEHPVNVAGSTFVGAVYELEFSADDVRKITEAAEAAGVPIIDYMQMVILAAATR